MIAAALATAAAGIFAGAAVFISLVQQPAAREIGTDFAAAFFAPMYRRAAPLQASLAIVGSVAAVVAGLRGGALWFVGAALLGAVVPWTLVAIKPTNDRLIGGARGAEAEALLERWGRLHALRTLSSLAAFALFVVALAVR